MGKSLVSCFFETQCMYVIFIRCDKRTSTQQTQKAKSQNDVQYKAAKPKKTIKTISLDKAI